LTNHEKSQSGSTVPAELEEDEDLAASPLLDRCSRSDRVVEVKEGSREDSRKFVCEVCGKSLRTRRQLIGHTRVVHLNERDNFRCEHCGKSFAWVADKARHVRRLHDEDYRS
jgi:uncharacterized protein with PIN domain